MPDRKAVVAILDEMGTLLELRGANPFKARAFANAARAVEGITRDLGDLVAKGELQTVKGIGASIAAIITELVTTGSAAEYRELREAVPAGLLDMLRIQGLGPKKVKAIHETLGIDTLADLEAAARGHRLASLPGFGEKTEENILKGIEALRVRGDKSLYPKAEEAAAAVFASLAAAKGVIRASVAGSLRRRKEVVGDIDILLSAREADRARLMEAFVRHPEVQSVAAHGDTKSSVVLNAGIPCDLRIVKDSEYPFALNYFTGSKEHNVAMRSRARDRGWSLNEYGFTPLAGGPRRSGKPPACRDEKSVYAALGLAYVEPELRESNGEIEAAAADALPDLVDEKDIRGTFHCHTTASDGVNTLQEMVEAARALGWEYLGIADHSKAAAYAGGLSEEKLRKQGKEIDALNARLRKFRVFKGTECDILPDGSLDWPDRVLAGLDFVVVSVHSAFRMTEAEMTRRIVRAVRNRHVTMLGHPTGRLLLAREGYPVDMIQVIDAAADHGTMIEINAHPSRLDLDWRLCRYAKEKGVLVPVNPDAHTVGGLRDVRYGVGVARKGWLEKKDVLNTRTLAAVEKLLERR